MNTPHNIIGVFNRRRAALLISPQVAKTYSLTHGQVISDDALFEEIRIAELLQGAEDACDIVDITLADTRSDWKM